MWNSEILRPNFKEYLYWVLLRNQAVQVELTLQINLCWVFAYIVWFQKVLINLISMKLFFFFWGGRFYFSICVWGKKLCNRHYFIVSLFFYSKFGRTDESCLSNFLDLFNSDKLDKRYVTNIHSNLKFRDMLFALGNIIM